MRTISKLIISILLFATGISASAQEWSKVFSNYNTRKGVEAVYISPEMFKMIGRLPEVEIMDKDVNLTSAVVSLKGLYVLESESSRISKELISDVCSFVKSKKMKLVMQEQDRDERSEIYTLMEGDRILCLLMLSTEDYGREADVIVIEGNLSQENFNKLINKTKRK